MAAPLPRFLPDSPLEVVSGRALFRASAARQRSAGSLARLDSGRLLLAFRLGSGPERRNDGAIVLTRSDNGGRDWEDPFPIYVRSGERH